LGEPAGARAQVHSPNDALLHLVTTSPKRATPATERKREREREWQREREWERERERERGREQERVHAKNRSAGGARERDGELARGER